MNPEDFAKFVIAKDKEITKLRIEAAKYRTQRNALRDELAALKADRR